MEMVRSMVRWLRVLPLLLVSLSAHAGQKDRALTETYFPELIKFYHSPSSALYVMPEARFYTTNSTLVAYKIMRLASATQVKSPNPSSCFKDPYATQRNERRYIRRDTWASAWTTEYFRNFVGKTGRNGEMQMDAFVKKIVDTAEEGNPSCRVIANAYKDSFLWVQHFRD